MFDDRKGDVIEELHLPCGQCDGCRIERARQWAVRCVHEAKMHEKNCVVTLTYNDKYLPDNGDLCYEDFQKFMKRLRKKFRGDRIRFFMCGEYGEDRQRPHFHACLFGIDFSDKVFFKTSASGSKLYISETLQRLWSAKGGDPFGFSLVGDLDFSAASYIARYVLKKQTSKGLSSVYDRIDQETGDVTRVTPEFVHMSLKPGIAYDFYKKWRADIFPQDICVVNGKVMKPPKYYFKKLADEDPVMYDYVYQKRVMLGSELAFDNTPERREVKERVLKSRLSFNKRELK